MLECRKCSPRGIVVGAMRRPPRDSGLGELLSTLGRCQWESGGSEVVDDDQQTPHARPRRWINCRAISALSRADSMFGPVVCEDVAGQHDPILQRSRASRGCAPVRPLHRGVVIGLPPCSAAGSLASQWRVRIASCCPSRARTTGCAGLPGRASRMPIRSRWRSCAPYMLSVPGNVSRRASAYLGS